MFIKRKTYNKLIKMAYCDVVTGLYNRNWFHKHYIETLQKTKQYDKIKAHNILTQSRQRLLSQNGLRKRDVVRIILLDLEREGLLVWKK